MWEITVAIWLNDDLTAFYRKKRSQTVVFQYFSNPPPNFVETPKMYKCGDFHCDPLSCYCTAMQWSWFFDILRYRAFKVLVWHIYGNYRTIRLIFTYINVLLLLICTTKNEEYSVITMTKFMHYSHTNPLVIDVGGHTNPP